MEITSVNVHKIDREDSRVKAYASVILDDCFKVSGIRVLQGEEKLYLAMPNRVNSNGERHDIANPINAETRKMFEDKIIEAYNNMES
ncbi:MAG: SpoVG family protein [Bacilli bacterium]|nr:SpoVG family protein [Bacilli bacterium]